MSELPHLVQSHDGMKRLHGEEKRKISRTLGFREHRKTEMLTAAAAFVIMPFWLSLSGNMSAIVGSV